MQQCAVICSCAFDSTAQRSIPHRFTFQHIFDFNHLRSSPTQLGSQRALKRIAGLSARQMERDKATECFEYRLV